MPHSGDMEKRRREAWAKWRKLVAEQKRSGESVAAFCRGRGLCAPHFFAWKKRLSQAPAQPFVAVQVVAAVEPPLPGSMASGEESGRGGRDRVPNSTNPCRIDGHTDSAGNVDQDMEPSRRRAEFVKQ